MKKHQLLAVFILASAVIQLSLSKVSWASQAQKVQIHTNAAMVFSKPTFDGDVIAYLPAGKFYWASKKKVARFYKINVAPKTYGWIVDADIRTADQLKRSRNNAASETDDITQVLSEEEKDEEIYFTRYAGPVLATVNFTEDTFAGKKSDDLIMFGMKIAGPNVLFEGPSLTSFNLLLHPGAPSYYENVTGEEAKGWLVLADFLISAPFFGGSNYMFYYSMGPLVRWNQFTVVAGGSTLDLQDIHLGATLELGAALQLGPMALRTECRYYWEVTQYRALALSLQMMF